MVYWYCDSALWVLNGWCHVKCCHFGASSLYTIQPCTRLQCHFIQSHIGRVYVCLAVTCHLHSISLGYQSVSGRMTGIFYVLLQQHGDGMDTEIRVSTESWPWRRKFSRRSCWDSNRGPFDHESDALITELFLLPDQCEQLCIQVNQLKWVYPSSWLVMSHVSSFR